MLNLNPVTQVDLRMNSTDSLCDDIRSVVESEFEKLNSNELSSGFNVLICQEKKLQIDYAGNMYRP